MELEALAETIGDMEALGAILVLISSQLEAHNRAIAKEKELAAVASRRPALRRGLPADRLQPVDLGGLGRRAGPLHDQAALRAEHPQPLAGAGRQAEALGDERIFCG